MFSLACSQTHPDLGGQEVFADDGSAIVRDEAARWAKATSAVAQTLIAAMKPGARIKELQALEQIPIMRNRILRL